MKTKFCLLSLLAAILITATANAQTPTPAATATPTATATPVTVVAPAATLFAPQNEVGVTWAKVNHGELWMKVEKPGGYQPFNSTIGHYAFELYDLKGNLIPTMPVDPATCPTCGSRHWADQSCPKTHKRLLRPDEGGPKWVDCAPPPGVKRTSTIQVRSDRRSSGGK